MPVSGVVTEVNDSLTGEPEKVNTDPYGEAWMVKVRLAKPARSTAFCQLPNMNFTKAESD